MCKNSEFFLMEQTFFISLHKIIRNSNEIMLRKIRLTLAVLFLLGISLLFLDFSGTVQPCLGWMAKLQFLPAVLSMHIVPNAIVLVLTLLIGRIYCSIICPLGVMQDFFAWIGKWKLFRIKKNSKNANKYSYSEPKTWLRLLVLVLFVAMLVSGFNAGAMMIAPYSAYGRIVASFIQPIYIGINNLLASWAEQNDSYMFYQVDVHNNPSVLFIVAGISALVLFVLAFMNGRTYCNTICPVGTVLGYVSKLSVFKMQADEDKCVKCGLCAKNCKASCIEVKKGSPLSIDYSRCVVCGDCQLACAKDALHLKPSFLGRKDDEVDDEEELTAESQSSATENSDSSISRRSFLSVMGLAAAATVSSKEGGDGGFEAIIDKKVPKRHTPLTPPGSLSARNLQQHCTACQLCIANCPNGVLRPDTSLEHLMQPVMEFEKGYCRPECTRCSSVCPTGAIRPITVEEKTAIQIGHAVVISKNCVPINDGISCGNCAKHCPTGAIMMVPVEKDKYKQNEQGWWTDKDGIPVRYEDILMRPTVNTEKCIGCGTCENLCPSRPYSAIYVEGHEVHRTI